MTIFQRKMPIPSFQRRHGTGFQNKCDDNQPQTGGVLVGRVRRKWKVYVEKI